MKRLATCVLAAFVTVAGIATAARADGTLVVSVLSDPSFVASLVCRTAKPGETPTAKTPKNTALECKPIDMKAIMTFKSSIKDMSYIDPTWQKLMNYMTIEYGR